MPEGGDNNYISAATLPIGRMIPSGANSPSAEESTQCTIFKEITDVAFIPI